MDIYALQIRKSDLPLITFLNDGVEPEITWQKTYLLIKIDGPNEVTTDIVTQRHLDHHHEISESTPFLMKLKK